jgi:hypothetical protein
MTKKTPRFRARLITVLLLILGVHTLGLLQPKVYAAPASCDGTSEKYYNCLLTWSDLYKEVNDWCSLSKSGEDSSGNSYRNICIYSLTADTTRSEPAVGNYQNEGGRVNDPKCYTDITGYDRNTLCWGYIKPGAWRDAIAGLIDECGLPPDQDAACAAEKKNEFLNSKGWADEPEEEVGRTIEGAEGSASGTPFVQRVSAYLRWLFLGIGVLAVFGFVIASIQYIAAQDNSQSVAAAKTRIVNIIYGVLIYMFMFALLQWLIPGGIF